MPKYQTFFSIVLLSLSLASAQITVACAANLRFAMEEIKTAFEIKEGIRIKTIYGASGMLTAQIRSAAPFDLMVSADMNYPESLFVWGLAVDRPKAYSFGNLVLWSATGQKPDPLMRCLKNVSIRKIGIPDPATAPYGREAEKAMRRAGMYEQLQSKLVFGENTTKTAQYIQLGAVDFGFTAKSMVTAGPLKNLGAWVEIDSSLCDPVEQGAVVLRYGDDNHPAASRMFFAFLFNKECQVILKNHGYMLPRN